MFRFARFALIVILPLSGMRSVSALSPACEIIASVSDQKLAVVDRGKLIARYPISTSKFGIGNETGSYRTPLGTLFVSGKFGGKLPTGAVIKNRLSTGEVLAANAPGRDAIVSRVIWLRGMETRNRAAHDRCITFTAHRRNAGLASRPASAASGCDRAM